MSLGTAHWYQVASRVCVCVCVRARVCVSKVATTRVGKLVHVEPCALSSICMRIWARTLSTLLMGDANESANPRT